jgi:hypothetical protein
MRANGVRKLPYDRGYAPSREQAMADFKARWGAIKPASLA